MQYFKVELPRLEIIKFKNYLNLKSIFVIYEYIQFLITKIGYIFYDSLIIDIVLYNF